MFNSRSNKRYRYAAALVVCAIVSVAFGSGEALAGGPPQPQITIGDTSGMAPFVVHVHATNSELGAGTPLTARYEWDFGDPSGRHNTLVGFNAAHMYEQPGQYTITLRITNENGETRTATRSVHVQQNTRRSLYVAPWGDDDDHGLNPNHPLRTFDEAVDRHEADTAILLHRGASYDVDHNHVIRHSNVLIGTWGDGGRPKLKWVGPLGYHAMVSSNGNVKHLVIQDIAFASNWPADYDRDIVDGIRPAGENITIDHCRFLDVSLAINTNQDPRRVLVMDCDTETIGAYFVWSAGDDHVYLNNSVGGSHFEHCIRMALTNRVLISGNTLYNEDKRSIWATHGTYVYIANNNIDSGRVTIGPNPYAGHTDSGYRWSVVEANEIEKLSGGTTPVECFPGASQIMLRNNVIRTAYISSIDLSGYDPATDMRLEDVYVYNNTGINETYIGRFLSAGAGARRLHVRNNLFSAPNLVTGDSRTANMYVDDNSLASFEEIARNVWAEPAQFNWVGDGYHYVWPSWSNAEGYRNRGEWSDFPQVDREAYARTTLSSSFAPPADSTAADHSRPVPGVHVDMYGRSRPATGKWSAGAVELNDVDGTGPDPLIAFEDDFETDRGWTVTNIDLDDGGWERGIPAGNGNHGDPTFDQDGSGRCWLTGNRAGRSDVDGGPTILTSPVIDLTGGSDPQLSFGRWIYCSDGSDDRIVTEVSANGGYDWHQIEIASSTGDWRHKTYRINDVIASTSQFQVRFVIADVGNNSTTEAAIDNVQVRYASLDNPPSVPGDVNGDGAVNASDLAAMFQQWGECSNCTGDLNGDGEVNLLDLLLMLSEYLV